MKYILLYTIITQYYVLSHTTTFYYLTYLAHTTYSYILPRSSAYRSALPRRFTKAPTTYSDSKELIHRFSMILHIHGKQNAIIGNFWVTQHNRPVASWTRPFSLQIVHLLSACKYCVFTLVSLYVCIYMYIGIRQLRRLIVFCIARLRGIREIRSWRNM